MNRRVRVPARLADASRAWEHRRRGVAAVAIALACGLLISVPALGLLFLALVASVGAVGLFRRDVAPLILLIVVLFATSPRHQFAVFQFPAVIMAALGVLVVWMLSRLVRPTTDSRGDRRVSIAVLVLAVTLLTSYVLGIARPLRFNQLEAADRDVLILLAMCAVAMFVSDVAKTSRTRHLIAAVLVGGAVFSATAGLVQQAFSLDITESLRLPGFRDAGLFGSGRERLGFTRAHGTARHPIEFGTSLALALPFALHFAASGLTSRSRLLGAGASTVIVLGMAVSLSRSAIVALATIAVVLLPAWPPRRRLHAVLASVALVSVMYIWQPERVDSAIELAVNWRGEEIQGADIQARTADYQVVMTLVSRYPILGEGYGTHVSFAPDNEYLDTAIESGVLGVAVLLGVLLTPLLVASRARKEAVERDDPNEADFAAATQASLAAGLVSLATYDGFSFPQFSFALFIVIGLAGALNRRTPHLHIGVADPQPLTATTAERRTTDARQS